MSTTTEEAIKQREANNQTPEIDEPANDEAVTPSDGLETLDTSSGLFGGLRFKRTYLYFLIGLAVVLALLAYSRKNADRSNAANEMDRALNDDLVSEIAVSDEDEPIHIPQNPTDELEKDAAALDALKARGKFGGDE